jgi:hypothetical protein
MIPPCGDYNTALEECRNAYRSSSYRSLRTHHNCSLRARNRLMDSFPTGMTTRDEVCRVRHAISIFSATNISNTQFPMCSRKHARPISHTISQNPPPFQTGPTSSARETPLYTSHFSTSISPHTNTHFTYRTYLSVSLKHIQSHTPSS